MFYQLLLSFTLAQLSSSSGRCTFHPYEEDFARLGQDLDNSPGWCGIRYSVLNLARIVAVNGLEAKNCVQCLEVSSASGGPKTFILAVDKKSDPGLDVAKSSYEAMFPGKNPLDPQLCQWKVVSYQKCGGICVAGEEECSTGKRNLLPAYLLPKYPSAQIGLDVSQDRSEKSFAVPNSNDGARDDLQATSLNSLLKSSNWLAPEPYSKVVITTTTSQPASTLSPSPPTDPKDAEKSSLSSSTESHTPKNGFPNLYYLTSSSKQSELCLWFMMTIIFL